MRFNTFFSFFCLLLLWTGCRNTQGEQAQTSTEGLSMDSTRFGDAPEGTAQLFILKNKNGMQVNISNYGGTITQLLVPDKNRKLADVVLGFDKLDGYLGEHPYFGATIGRYGNRIAKGKFSIDGQEYTLATNNAPNALHGGPMGFHKHLWQAKKLIREGYVGLELSRLSMDGEEGYPGDLTVTVRYLLNNSNELLIEYEATTTKPTVVNLTNHSYFNLKGAGNGDILDHQLMINADAFTPVDSTLIPTGEIRKVEGTPFDFRTPAAIGAKVNTDDQQIKYGLGYDHNFVLTRKGTDLELAASAYEPISGRFMEVLTTEPGIQFYCGNFLNGTNVGKGGIPYEYRTGFCLETQHYPDSPNHPAFPSTVLRPGEKYETRTVYRFSAK